MPRPPARAIIGGMVKTPAGKKPAPRKSSSAKNLATAEAGEAESAALTPRQQRFVEEYLVDLNGTQAAIRAGYSARTANEQAARLLANVSVRSAIERGKSEVAARTGASVDELVSRMRQIILADPRELVKIKTGCCRYCYGDGHQYQRSEDERAYDLERWLMKGKAESDFDEKGGSGFNPALRPVEACPVCGGDGESRVVPLDTSTLSPGAALLYAGAKQTKYGLEVQMVSKEAMYEKLMRHLGGYAKDNEQAGKAIGAAVKELNDSERAVRMARMFEGNPGALVAMLQSFAQKAKA